MGGRKSDKHDGGDATMDMMTALIGCLILILIGILVIIMVSQALIVVVTPDKHKVQAIQTSNVDGLPQDNGFPDGNDFKEPSYIDVHREHIVIYPGKVKVTKRQLDNKRVVNDFDRKVKFISENKDAEYVVFLVRPHAATLARRLRKRVLESSFIDVGTELVMSTFEFDHVSGTQDMSAQERKDAKALADAAAELSERLKAERAAKEAAKKGNKR